MDRAGVPIVAVDEDGDAVLRQDEIRSTAGGEGAMEPEPSTCSVQRLSEEQLGLSVDLLAPR
jgi:hypothetical protein